MPRYSLRTLLILLAVGPMIVGRAIHCQLRAAAHEWEMQTIAAKLCPPEDLAGTNTPRYMKEYFHHQRLAEAYLCLEALGNHSRELPMKLRFSIRDVLWLMVGAGRWVDRRRCSTTKLWQHRADAAAKMLEERGVQP